MVHDGIAREQRSLCGGSTVKPVVLAWRVTCFACGRVLAETTSYKSANGIWTQHKNAHARADRPGFRPAEPVRPRVELIRIEGKSPGVDQRRGGAAMSWRWEGRVRPGDCILFQPIEGTPVAIVIEKTIRGTLLERIRHIESGGARR